MLPPFSCVSRFLCFVWENLESFDSCVPLVNGERKVLISLLFSKFVSHAHTKLTTLGIWMLMAMCRSARR